ncbi:MAG TPA: sugar phosphate isomerase/epimerase family protein [Phycisphaerae bacterium]|nr:sugar phosphate isomerase/epimerase family protein [Phycisphaerae bacterium]HOJ72381.1 sugar phosphate isomerase/epimerase family protein [Phycisphaerae bacterium]HOM49957.1 sugar phosphate isomerase/epimerase family protein [Phycisphaerae bacterium]HON66322.1 sugar phosphate isomerase/epimerase family protein [Phycisphaerae bacterium]HOQ84584.1 sugar phosphate isomerase/epimerase family protein [Phycisphaerae bacterium]
MFKLATCNEPWNGVASIEEVFQIAARIGFDGVEIAPFTLADHVDEISAARRKEIVRAAADAGVEIVGLHWLFVSPKGLHLTTADASVRRTTSEYLKSLANFCGDLGGKVMILGSPKQRNIEPPTTHDEGWKRAKDVLAACGDTLAARGVTLCIEALSPKETNFIQTLDESTRMADEIGHPNIDVMIDVKAMASMPDGVIGTIQRFGRRAKHFHANHPSAKGVGMPLGPGDGEPVDWPAVLQSLQQSGFTGWVSCEPFDYKPDPTTVAETAYRVLSAAQPR